MLDIVASCEAEFEKIVNFFQKDIVSIRTNRASPDLVKNLLIEAYGTRTPLEQLSSINSPEPRVLVIEPWDKNILKEIEKGLSNLNLGCLPQLKEGGILYLILPPLNEETRKNLVKILKEKQENAKRKLRSLRDEVREKIIQAEKEKSISQDDKYRFFEKLDLTTAKITDKIKTISENKEREIMTV